MARGALARGLGVAGVVLAAAACGTPGPRPFAFGSEPCAHCHMTLADPRFAAELVARTGKVFPFDDAGCLAAFVVAGGLRGADVASLWVADFTRPDSLLTASGAVFLRHDAFHTPMDYRIVAFRDRRQADSARAALGGGEILSWTGVLDRVRGSAAP